MAKLGNNRSDCNSTCDGFLQGVPWWRWGVKPHIARHAETTRTFGWKIGDVRSWNPESGFYSGTLPLHPYRAGPSSSASLRYRQGNKQPGPKNITVRAMRT